MSSPALGIYCVDTKRQQGAGAVDDRQTNQDADHQNDIDEELAEKIHTAVQEVEEDCAVIVIRRIQPFLATGM